MLYICSNICLFFPVSPIQHRSNQQVNTLSQNAHDQTSPHFEARFTDVSKLPRPALQHDHFSMSLGMGLMNAFTALEEADLSVMHTFTDIKHAKLSKDLCSLDLSLYYFQPPHGFMFAEQNNLLGYY